MSRRYPTRAHTIHVKDTPETPEDTKQPAQDSNVLVRDMLTRIEACTSYADKVTASARLFRYLYEHPALFTARFKDTLWDKMGELDGELANSLYRIPATIDSNDRHTRTAAISLLMMIDCIRERYYY